VLLKPQISGSLMDQAMDKSRRAEAHYE